MNRKLPPEAFDAYVAMGDQHRTYAAVAKQYGVSKRCVTKRAAQEHWTERLETIRAQAREAADKQSVVNLVEMQERHLKVVRLMATRSLEGLRDMRIDSAMDAIKAADMTIKLERLLAGEATARTEKTIEEVTRQEIRTLLKVVPDEPEPRLVEATVSSNVEADEEE